MKIQLNTGLCLLPPQLTTNEGYILPLYFKRELAYLKIVQDVCVHDVYMTRKIPWIPSWYDAVPS